MKLEAPNTPKSTMLERKNTCQIEIAIDFCGFFRLSSKSSKINRIRINKQTVRKNAAQVLSLVKGMIEYKIEFMSNESPANICLIYENDAPSDEEPKKIHPNMTRINVSRVENKRKNKPRFFCSCPLGVKMFSTP